MAEEIGNYSKSEMPTVAEKRPEEESSKQVVSILEAWDMARKTKEEFIGKELWRELTEAVNDLSMLRDFDSAGETESFKILLSKLTKLGEHLRDAEGRSEQVKEGKKFASIIGEALFKMTTDNWFDFWTNLNFSGPFIDRGSEVFRDLSRFIMDKYGPPMTELGAGGGKRFMYYEKPGTDLIFEIIITGTGEISRIQLVKDQSGRVREMLRKGEVPVLRS